MKVLVTGASGFVGKQLSTELLNKGHSVLGSTRSQTGLPKGVDFINVGEINALTEWSEVLNDVDVIIHLAARVHVMHELSINPIAEFRRVNVEGTIKLAKQASASGVKRFIYVSSVKVNGEFTKSGNPFNEEIKPNPQDPYGVSKFEAEQSLMQISKAVGMEVVIIRPPLVYGEGVKANFARMLHAIKSQTFLPLGRIKNQRSLIYIGNLVNFIILCMQHPKAANQVFLISDGDDLSTTELLQKSANALGVKARLFPIPKWLIVVAATTLGQKRTAQRLCSNLQVDISKARELLDWAPPFSVTQGVNATAADWQQGKQK